MEKSKWELLFEQQDIINLDIHTGNVIDDLKRKTALNSTEEVIECIGFSMNSNETKIGKDEVNRIFCINKKHPVVINKEERKDLKLTVKVFLSSYDTVILETAIDKALKELDVTFIESVITALPPSDNKITLEEIKPLWITLEKLIEEKKILAIGISDLDTELLMHLHQWAKVKPAINQINLASCCVIPPEMQQFAKENDIQLLTHNDSKDLLPEEQLNKWMSSSSQLSSQNLTWKSTWILRFSALVKCRGVIQNKGYIVSLQGQAVESYMFAMSDTAVS